MDMVTIHALIEALKPAVAFAVLAFLVMGGVYQLTENRLTLGFLMMGAGWVYYYFVLGPVVLGP